MARSRWCCCGDAGGDIANLHLEIEGDGLRGADDDVRSGEFFEAEGFNG
jgi:hypothetical protein